MGDYAKAGGVVPTGPELKDDLLDTFPKEISDALAWRATEVKESFDQYVSHIKATARKVLSHRNKLSSPPNLTREFLECVPCSGGYADAAMALYWRFLGATFGGRPCGIFV